jgi:PAS domain S-box-containing protein
MAFPEEAAENQQQVNDLFNSVELTNAMGTEDFRHFLDLFPIAVLVSKLVNGDQRIVYANKAAEGLTGQDLKDIIGRGWSILADYKNEADLSITLQQEMSKPAADEYHGTFQKELPQPLIVEAYAALIDNQDGTANYRILALIDVTARARAEREEFAAQLRDKDLLLKELQHRVKNNLQLITALIRLDARGQRKGDVVNLDRLAGRIESLQLLYRDLSMDGLGQSVDLGHYVSEIASAVMHTYGVNGIRIDIKVDYALVSVNVAMPVGLLVNELLTNAFKYAFVGREGGTLTIRCLLEGEDNYCIVVGDDGVGLPADTMWPVSGKLGSLILKSLEENTKASHSVETAPGKGTRVKIQFTHRPIGIPNN